MEDKKTCFVVTPIGDDNTAIRRHIDGIIDQAIIPAIGENFEVKVAHREFEIGSINDRVIQSVYNSDLVIANLTGLNPNVMFEIAVRYSFGKPAIVIAEKGTKLPFDIVEENTIFYINDPAGAAELKETIRKFVDKIDWEKNEYGPVFSAIKSASLINSIETGLTGDENKNAFAFLVEKISDLESEIRGMRIRSKDVESLNGQEIVNIANFHKDFINELVDRQNDISKDQLAILLYNYLNGISFKTGVNKDELIIYLLKQMIQNNDLLSDKIKTNSLKLLERI